MGNDTENTLPPFLAMPKPKQTPPVQPKSGLLTSEFWLHILALVVPGVIGVLQHSGDPTLVIAAQVAASIYTMSRTHAKNAAAQVEPQQYVISSTGTPGEVPTATPLAQMGVIVPADGSQTAP